MILLRSLSINRILRQKLLKLINQEFNVEANGERKYQEDTSKEEEDIDIESMALSHLQNNFNEKVAKKLLGKAKESIEEYVKRDYN